MIDLDGPIKHNVNLVRASPLSRIWIKEIQEISVEKISLTYYLWYSMSDD